MKRTYAVVLLILTAAFFTACEKEGPAEQAGAKVDQAVESAGQKIEEAGDAIREKTDQ